VEQVGDGVRGREDRSPEDRSELEHLRDLIENVERLPAESLHRALLTMLAEGIADTQFRCQRGSAMRLIACFKLALELGAKANLVSSGNLDDLRERVATWLGAAPGPSPDDLIGPPQGRIWTPGGWRC
jgi:hypothetical protein